MELVPITMCYGKARCPLPVLYVEIDDDGIGMPLCAACYQSNLDDGRYDPNPEEEELEMQCLELSCGKERQHGKEHCPYHQARLEFAAVTEVARGPLIITTPS